MTLIRAEGKFSVINKFCNPLDKKQIYVIISSASQRCGYGRLAQLVEHSLDVRRVSGSSPLTSTKRASDEYFLKRVQSDAKQKRESRFKALALFCYGQMFYYPKIFEIKATNLPIVLLIITLYVQGEMKSIGPNPPFSPVSSA